MKSGSWGIISLLTISFIAATVMSTVLLILLNDLQIIKIKRRSDYFIWGIVGGILISFVFVTMQCNKTNNRQNQVGVHADSTLQK